MSLSPFDSFQSRFVTYLLNFPRISFWMTSTNVMYCELRCGIYLFERTEGSEHVAVFFAACNSIAAELCCAHCVLSPHNNVMDRDICILMFGCRCDEM